MPGGGAKPGERRGGRPKGGKNLTTLERELYKGAITRQFAADQRRREESLRRLEQQAEMAATAVQQLREQGKPLAKDALGLFLEIFMGRAAYYQPRPKIDDPKVDQNKFANEEKFEKWARLSVDCAKALAPFQSPTYRAIVVAPPPPTQSENQTRRFTLAIFDHTGQTIEAVATTNEIIRQEAEEDA